MTKVLLSIGCNRYEHLNPLNGAEQDAAKVFELLTGAEGDYEQGRSRLLLSPTHAELMAGLDEVLFSDATVEVFTIFFAGHGGVKQGNYYLCVADTDADRLSTTGLALVSLFTMISERKPQQANVIMDACQAGGAMRDTASLMKPEIIGDVNSMSVSFLAACASTEYASEDAQGGVVTTEILNVLTGRELIQDTKPYLDLVEVGRAVSESVRQKAGDQTPVTWGLNLFGQSKFAKNPHFTPSAHPEFPTFIESVVPASPAGEVIRNYSGALWDAYKHVTGELNYRRLVNLLSAVCVDLEKSGESCVPFIRGVATSLSATAASSPDLFAEAGTMSCCALALLPFTGDEEKRALVRDFIRERSLYVEQAGIELGQSLKANRFALLNTTRAPSDFFYLPIRVSKTLGWLASEIVIDGIFGEDDRRKNDSIRSLAEMIVHTYGGVLVSMSDEQAPYAYLLAKACRLRGWDDLAAAVLGAMFESLVSVRGAVARVNLEPPKAYDYTIARAYGHPGGDFSSVAQPSQLLAALILCGSALGTADDWNRRMVHLDHRTTNIFLPDDYLDFGAEVIYRGRNYTFRIGHDVWTLADLVGLFEKNCGPGVRKNDTVRAPEVKALCVLSSCLFPNRIPYFLEVE